MNALTVIEPQSNVDAYRESTEAADICKAIVIATASNIQGRKYVAVEGWMAIARAHGCSAGARDVERVDGGIRAIGEVRRMFDGAVIATAEGFVGEDEPTWYGGDNGRGRMLPKRADYAIRAMAQTRAMSRACRSAFAHVVVMMNAGLATTPAEEVPHEGFDDRNAHIPQADYAEVQPQHDAAPKGEKKPLPPGKHTARTKLQAAIRDLKLKGNEVTDRAAFEALATEYEPDLQQLQEDEHHWWTATEFESVPAWLQRRRAELSDESGIFDALLASMRECETQKSLTGWVQRSGDVIDSLTDEQRRAFETAYEKHESAIMTMAAHN